MGGHTEYHKPSEPKGSFAELKKRGIKIKNYQERDIKTGERFYIRLCKFCTDYKGQRSAEVHKGIIPNAKKSATKGKLGTKSKTKAIGKRKGVPARRKTTNNGKKRRK